MRSLTHTAALVAALLLPLLPTPVVAQPADLDLTQVVTGLTRPVAIRHAGDGSGRLFIVEQAGRILVWDGASAPTEFLNIVAQVDDLGNEQGLLGLAFHPNFASNGLFYVNYTRDPGPGLDRTIVERYSVSAGDPNVADASSATTIIEIEQDSSNHNGGNILFGPDGLLYIGMGDGGGANDTQNRAQTTGNLLGKMLRIDVDTARQPDVRDTESFLGGEACGLNGNYLIPGDNALPGSNDGCDEIWALGLRNPWRFSFDRLNGDLFIGDVGQGQMEEISYQAAGTASGVNFGWSCREGTLPQNFNPCLPGPLTDPILTYLHNQGGTFVGCSVTGGYVYRGNIIGDGFFGTYVYGDNCTGNMWLATRSDSGWESTLWRDTGLSISAYGEDEDGELYLVDLDGSIFLINSPGSIFTDGFETGDLTVWASASP
ncbi:MAG: PQQ-dependent sugar dehydrogenase [Acidobacteriota bacterium]